MSLLAPDLLAEVVLEIRPDGSWQLTVSKLPPDPQLPLIVVRAILGAGFDLAKNYGISISKAEMTT